MDEIDKIAMGQRIKQIRQQAQMRQWEMARRLGTTQSAVHKYEHGVVPEPRRLLELARIGRTSLEWLLTGRHWENGSTDRHRLSPELLGTACLLREIGDEERAAVDEALAVVRQALQALQEIDAPDAQGFTALKDHGHTTLQILEAACRIQRAVLHQVLETTGERLSRSPGATGQAIPGAKH